MWSWRAAPAAAAVAGRSTSRWPDRRRRRWCRDARTLSSAGTQGHRLPFLGPERRGGSSRVRGTARSLPGAWGSRPVRQGQRAVHHQDGPRCQQAVTRSSSASWLGCANQPRSMRAPGRERVLFIVAHTENCPSRARPPCAEGWSRSAKMPSERKVSGLRKRCLSRPVVPWWGE